MAQPVDAVALHQPHRAGIEIGPDRLGTVPLRGARERLGDLVERLVPGDRREGRHALALRPDPAQRLRQAIGMMLALGIARDLGADDAGRVGIVAAAPRTRPMRVQSRRSTSSAQVLGQSCGQTEWTVSRGMKGKDSMGIKRGLTLWITV